WIPMAARDEGENALARRQVVRIEVDLEVEVQRLGEVHTAQAHHIGVPGRRVRRAGPQQTPLRLQELNSRTDDAQEHRKERGQIGQVDEDVVLIENVGDVE